jgi:hypothetical protein
MSICVDMKELSTYVGNLNAFLEFDLLSCLRLQDLLTSIS